MDGTTLAIAVGLVEIALLVILWVRVRAVELLVVEEMSLRVAATRQAIDTLHERLSSPSRGEGAYDERREKRRKGIERRRRP